jgi:hypothetical protein
MTDDIGKKRRSRSYLMKIATYLTQTFLVGMLLR